MIGEKHLAAHFDMGGFLRQWKGVASAAFHVEEFSLTTKSLPQLFPKPVDLGLRTACILENHDTYFSDVHEGQNFFKLLPINPVYVERGNRDVAAFKLPDMDTFEGDGGGKIGLMEPVGWGGSVTGSARRHDSALESGGVMSSGRGVVP